MWKEGGGGAEAVGSLYCEVPCRREQGWEGEFPCEQTDTTENVTFSNNQKP